MRIAVIGLGWVATAVWLPRLLARADCTVVAGVEPDPEAAARAARLLGSVPVYGGHEDLPADGIDAALVLTPNGTHARIAAWCLRHGLAVLLEKPACTDLAELDVLAEAARAGAGTLMLSAAARHRRDVTALRSLVAAGELGEPRVADLSWIRARGIPRGSWFRHAGSAGGGVLFDLGWHLIDVVLDLWGSGAVRDAAAFASTDFLHDPGRLAAWHADAAGPADVPGDVEDRITGLVTTERYALALAFAWSSHEAVDRTVIELHGTEATAELRTTFGFSPNRLPGSSLRLKRGGTVTEIDVGRHATGEEYDRQLDEFLRPRTAAETQRSLARAGDVLAVIDACYRAADLRPATAIR
ncbi:Gfo/Idh/MocA family oxidoreductase [Dactylosporangium sp. NPDC049140]|jgi:oxidoreductase|uniref:Gfo/Idh/MocA family protein n=1 Tax=Dactylosporangium sp. NPDC049140 TaxID=3155647 RepID=UPI0033DD4052